MRSQHFLDFFRKMKEYVRRNIFEKKLERRDLYYQTKYQRDMTDEEKKEYTFRIFVVYTFPLIVICLLLLYAIF